MADGDLLERSEQRASIEDALHRARDGDGGVLFIEGAAGIGKSRLLQELRQLAGPGQRVLYARASELERGFAFGVVRQLFEAIVRDPELGPVACAGAAAAARDIFEETPSEDHTASFALLHGLYWLTLNLAEHGPVILAIDDLHWCDASSLRFLAYLGRRLEGTPILIGATTRPLPPASTDAEPLAELLSEPRAVQLFPQALSEGAAAELLATQLGAAVDPAFAAACFAATDGNPLMLRQLARSLQAEGTTPVAANAAGVRRVAHRALSRTVLARVGRYSAAALQVARAAAVLGDWCTVQQVAELAELKPPAVATAWSDLVDAEVLRREGLGFVHALVRDAIYFDMLEPDRAALHLRAARVLAEEGASVERIASQLELAPRTGDPWITEIEIQAGDAAQRRGSPEAAARHLRRALDEPPPAERRTEVISKLAEVSFDVDGDTAIVLLRELIELQPDLQSRAPIGIRLVQALALSDQWDEADRLCRESEARYGDQDDDVRAILQSVRAAATFFGADDPGALDNLVQYRSLQPGEPLGHRLRAGIASMWWAYNGGTADECAALAARAIDSDPTILRDHTLIAVAPLFVLGMADRTEGLDLWQRARDDARRTGSLILAQTVDLWLGFTQHRRGDLTNAISGLTDALTGMKQWGSGVETQRFARAALALAYADTGALVQARAVLDDSPPPLEQAAPSLGAALWWHAETWVLFAENRLQEALAATEKLKQAARWMPTPIGVDWSLPRALTLYRLGQQDAAMAAAQQGVTLARGWGSPSQLGAAIRIRGEIQGDAGLDDLAEAVELLEGSTAKIQLTRSLITYGAVLRRNRRPTEARGPLERAHEIAEACGSPLLMEQARTELAAAGVRRQAGDASGAGALTPSERRVADLAAAGSTNREIAQELFVTPKTVEVHLSATYRKLGISSRHALSGALTS
jgi:DNA-binding NarL/FixJ family response regulator/transposase-like protein